MRLRSKLAGALGAAALAAGSGLLGGGTAHASVVFQGPYQILNAGTGGCLSVWASGLCMEPAASSSADGTPLVQMQCSADTLPAQRWNFYYLHGIDPHVYALIDRDGISPRNHSCMDLRDGSTEDGATVQIWACLSNEPNQWWEFR